MTLIFISWKNPWVDAVLFEHEQMIVVEGSAMATQSKSALVELISYCEDELEMQNFVIAVPKKRHDHRIFGEWAKLKHPKIAFRHLVRQPFLCEKICCEKSEYNLRRWLEKDSKCHILMIRCCCRPVAQAKTYYVNVELFDVWNILTI